MLFRSVVIVSFFSCSSRNALTEEKAIKAGEFVINSYNNDPNKYGSYTPDYTIVSDKWIGLIQTSETAAELRGQVHDQRRQRGIAKGKFNFIKSTDGQWILDSYYFSGPGYFWSGENVFYKVPN